MILAFLRLWATLALLQPKFVPQFSTKLKRKLMAK